MEANVSRHQGSIADAMGLAPMGRRRDLGRRAPAVAEQGFDLAGVVEMAHKEKHHSGREEEVHARMFPRMVRGHHPERRLDFIA